MFLVFTASLLLFQDWTFTDVTASAGVSWNHSYQGSSDGHFIAAGAASADIDLDGWPDLYVLGGENQSNALFRNLGNGQFQNITASAGVATSGRFNCGAAFADVDGDGYPDLIVGAIGASPILFHNRGDGSFEDITASAGLSMAGSSFSAAFADTDRDGDLDLFLSHWQTGNNNFFFENDGQGHFSNATTKVGLNRAFLPDLSFTPNFVDLNGDHWPDLLVACDLGHSKVFRNDGAGRFLDVTDAVITDENGMGAAIGDYDNDGIFDWFVSSVGQAVQGKKGVTGNRLYRGLGDGHFVDATAASGVREGGWGWGSSLADFDNDGWLDLYHTNGFLGPFAPGYGSDTSRFFHNNADGSFSEQAAALNLADSLQGRGVVCFDYDRDGDLDLFIAFNGAPGRLMRNDGGNRRNWLMVELQGNRKNTGAIGTHLELDINGQRQIREMRAGNNFVSQDPHIAHFGMGEASTARLVITWPDGTVETHENIAANQYLKYTQAAPANYCDPEQRRWLPHVTSLTGSFRTRLFAANLGQQTGIADLVAYAHDGNLLASVSLALDPGQQLALSSEELFGSQAVSHIAVYAPDRLMISAGYTLAEGASAAAHAHERHTPASSFYYYPGNWELVYDGMALLNPGHSAISVRAELLDQEGEPVLSEELAAALAPSAKLLSVFNDLFRGSPSHMIRIVCDGPALAFFLRGTLADITPGLLFQVDPIPVPE